MMTSHLAVVLAFLVAWPVAAQDTPLEAARQEKKICQTERVTGSRTRSTHICMRDEWDRLRREAKQDLENLQRNSGAIPRQQSGPGAPAGSG